MPFGDILGQDHAIELICHSVHTDRMPHAWLFTGQANIGKFKTAVALAQKLNCSEIHEDACGKCDFCLQIKEEIFPDFLVVRPEGKFIKIDQVRNTLNWLNLHPDQANKRVLILDRAENLGREAANAFLKTLEEPAPNTIIILIALSTKQLPETIVSRCQHIRFSTLSQEITEYILRKNTDLSEELMKLISVYGMGSVKMNLVNSFEIRQTVQNTAIKWLTTFKSETLEDLLRTCEVWGKSKNEEWRFLLDFLEIWFRDLTWIRYCLPENKLLNRDYTLNLDRVRELKQCGKYFTQHQIFEIFRKIKESRAAIDLNANKSLAIESLCLHIYRYAT